MICKNRDNMVRIVIATLIMLCVMCIVFMFPDLAFATNSSSSEPVGFTKILKALQNIVTYVMLPVGVIMSAWKLIYLAVICGMGGIDPLGMCDEGKVENWGTTFKQNVWGFVKGLFWVGGIFLIFELIISLAAGLAGVIGGAF